MNITFNLSIDRADLRFDPTITANDDWSPDAPAVSAHARRTVARADGIAERAHA